MHELSSKEILARIAAREGTKNDTELGEVLSNRAKSTVSNWRKRNTIPVEEIAEYCFERELSLDWVLTGRASNSANSIDLDIATAIINAIEGKEVAPEKIKALANHIGSRWPMSESEIKELIALAI